MGLMNESTTLTLTLTFYERSLMAGSGGRALEGADK